ncbi:membrane protein [Clostridium acetobutylicum]|nr:membrane protein [Clostridium acetobutylicum]
MIYVLNIMFLICSFTATYYIRYFIKFKFNSRYKKAKESNLVIKHKTYDLIKLFNLKLIEDKLIKSGNPFKLNFKTYIFIKFVTSAIGAIASLQYIGLSFSGCLFGIAASILGFFLVDILDYLSNKDDKNKIRLDLADVYDLITIQTIAGVSVGHALLEANTVCKSKRLKKSLIRLAAKINLSKNIEKALDEFNQEYDMHEIDAFVAVIKESITSGVSEEALDDQSSALKTLNSFYTASETEKIDIHVLIISMLLLGGIICIIYYCIGSNLMQSAHGIFS